MKIKTIVIFLTILLIMLWLTIRHRQNVNNSTFLVSTTTQNEVRDNTISPVIPGDFVIGQGDYEYTITLGNAVRRYLVHVPKSYNKKQVVPLVLFFHGGGGNMNHSSLTYGWKEKSDQEGFIIAFTNGDSRLPNDKFATWNAGNCCAHARDANIDDIGYTREVIKDIKSKFAIDPKRVYATGMSNGGMMVYRLACDLANEFTAVASVAGTDGTLTCTPTRPISILHIHAKDDTHVLFGGGAGQDAFSDLDKVADFISVAETITRWVKRNHTNTTPKRILEVPGAYCDLYVSSVNTTQVKLCVTETGGHSWPGSLPVRGKEPSRAIIANDVIWDFFKDQK